MNNRQQIINKIKKQFPLGCVTPIEIAEFVIEDRKEIHLTTVSVSWHRKEVDRIVHPLVIWNEWDKKGCFGNDYSNHLEGAKKANRQTLQNAGVNNG